MPHHRRLRKPAGVSWPDPVKPFQRAIAQGGTDLDRVSRCNAFQSELSGPGRSWPIPVAVRDQRTGRSTLQSGRGVAAMGRPPMTRSGLSLHPQTSKMPCTEDALPVTVTMIDFIRSTWHVET